jgi:RNA polymerase sigma factor (sigma-70 family)
MTPNQDQFVIETNTVARRYLNGDMDALYDMVELLKPLIRREARKWGRMYQRGVTADFESYFYQAVWKALESYDGSTKFIAWYYRILRQHGKEWRRKLLTLKREIDNHCDSLTTSDGGQRELQSTDVFEEDLETKEMITYFLGKVDDQTKQIIKMVINGYANNEIAYSLGADSYSPAIRKKVQRAKEKMRRVMIREQQLYHLNLGVQ